MANIYVRSTDGSDADNGSTWALAKATLAGAFAIESAGDTIYLSSIHNESTASSVTLTSSGTSSNTVRVISVTDSSEPPITVTNGAVITTTGASSIILTGSVNCVGLTFNVGTGASAANWQAQGNTDHLYENCAINLVNTSTSSSIYLSNSSVKKTRFLKCNFSLSAAQQIFANNGESIITGGSVTASVAQTSGVFSGAGTFLILEGVDLSAINSTSNLFSSNIAARVTLKDCKLPATWSGSLVASGTRSSVHNIRMYNCDSGATNYRLWIETYAGSIKSETTIVKSSGATDGTTPISWKLATTANANEYVAPLITDDMAIWIDTTGASKTITVDILHDSTTALTDAEVWLEIDYLGSSATPLGTPASDKRATVLTTPTNQATSTATWTTTGMTNPNKQKLEVTFTPNMKGFVYARVNLAKASYTIYVDPEPVLS